MDADSHDQMLEEQPAAADDVEMPEGERIESTSENGRTRRISRFRAHGESPADVAS
jgi:hypothetical protein